MTTRIKDAMFFVFGARQLDSINNNSTPVEVSDWKNSRKTKDAYQKLFTPINPNNPEETYMFKILSKMWPSANTTNIKSAYAITVCQTMLSSHYELLTIKEKIVKRKLLKNLVSNLIYFNINQL